MPASTKYYAMSVFATAFAVMTSGLSALAADAERGKQYAERVCSLCHAISGSQASPNPDARPFRVIARNKNFRTKKDAWLWERHAKMPNLAFTREEAADVSAYIRSLRKQR